MDKLERIQTIARAHGVKGRIDVAPPNSHKKFAFVREDGKRVLFGQYGAEDYHDHQDKERRRRFRARMSGIRLKDGRRAIDVKGSPAWLSFYLLW